MHISLDSALGRQRRLNSVGESVLQIAPNAAAAYSLRSLTGGDPRVVRVRRDTDNAEQDFTASGISSGALVDFATSGNGVFANTGYESFTNASASGFTASNTGSTGFAVSDILDGVSGDAVSVSFDIDITNGSPGLSLRTALNGGSTASNSATYTTSGSKTATLTGNKSYVGIGFTEGDAPSNFTVSNFKVLGSGFVETWYDQSGNGEDAVQETSGNQPKIVSAGALVADGIDFDGSNDRLNMPNDLIASINSASAFLVAKSDTISGSRIALALSHSTSNFRFYAGALLGNKLNFGYQNTAVKIELGSADTNKHLFTSIAGSSNVEAFLDGTSKGTVSSVDGKSTLSSGGIGSINSGNLWSGTIEEVIVYNTDQSANRVALETNIQAQYPTLP